MYVSVSHAFIQRNTGAALVLPSVWNSQLKEPMPILCNSNKLPMAPGQLKLINIVTYYFWL